MGNAFDRFRDPEITERERVIAELSDKALTTCAYCGMPLWAEDDVAKVMRGEYYCDSQCFTDSQGVEIVNMLEEAMEEYDY